MARMFAMFGFSTVQDTGAHYPSAILDGYVVGQYLRHCVPVASREVRLEALVHLACRIFQPRCQRVELIESRERGVEVDLVEHLASD